MVAVLGERAAEGDTATASLVRERATAQRHRTRRIMGNITVTRYGKAHRKDRDLCLKYSRGMLGAEPRTAHPWCGGCAITGGLRSQSFTAPFGTAS